MNEYDPHSWTTSTLNEDEVAVAEPEPKKNMTQKPSMVEHPRHYNREGAMECIDEMELIFGPEVVMHFCLGCVFKYRYRAGLKNDGYQDLEKSDWYMRKYKELKEKVNESKNTLTIQSPPWQINPVVTYCNTQQQTGVH